MKQLFDSNKYLTAVPLSCVQMQTFTFQASDDEQSVIFINFKKRAEIGFKLKRFKLNDKNKIIITQYYRKLSPILSVRKKSVNLCR